jgi:hypothetical protein
LLTTDNNLFGEFVVASIFTPHQSWYEKVFKLECEHHQGFDNVCQQILGDLFEMFEVSLFAPKTTTQAKYFLHVLRYLQGCGGSKFTTRIEQMPVAELRKRGGNICLVQVLSQMMMRWITTSMTTLSLRLNVRTDVHGELLGELDEENEKREVNRFLGWAIWHLRRKLALGRREPNRNGGKLADNVEPLIEHLDQMRCFHHHALIDTEYMKNCYAQADQSRNGGWLSLVSKDYFSFGKVLMQKIRDNVQQKEWAKHGNDSIQKAAAAISGDAGIKTAFFDASIGSPISCPALQSLMEQIVVKTFHARVAASMNTWKRNNTAREVKGSTDASFRADLKSKVSQTTKQAGEFQIRKRAAQFEENSREL